MTPVLNPLAHSDIGPFLYYWIVLGTRNRIHYCTFLVELQKAAIREGLGSFREEKREEETAEKPFLSNSRNPGSFREEKREGETAQKPFPLKHRNPGRSGKVPGRFPGRDVSTVSSVFSPFSSVSPQHQISPIRTMS